MSEFLPCPFCGGEAELVEADYGMFNTGYAVYCHSCCTKVGVTGRLGEAYEWTPIYDTEADAIAAWNSRSERVTDDEWEIYQRSVPATEENMAMFGWVRERTCHIVKNSRKYVLSDGCELFEDGCSICNSYIGDGDNYCSNCGAKVVANA